MVYAAYNYTISDASGNIVTGSSIEVRRESDNVLVPLYSDRAGSSALANPFTDSTGTGRFHAAGSAYKVTATLGAFTRTFRYVAIGLSGEVDTIFESITTNSGEGVSIDNTDPSNPVVSGVAFTGDSGAGGVKGMVPAPAAGDAAANKYLAAGGSWVAVSGPSTTETLTNKRITPRVTTITSSGTPTINTNNCDIVNITALAAAITSMTTNLTGTASIGDVLIFQIKDNGTARAITWGASFTAKGVALPTTTVISKLLTVAFMWNGTDWGCIGSAQEV